MLERVSPYTGTCDDAGGLILNFTEVMSAYMMGREEGKHAVVVEIIQNITETHGSKLCDSLVSEAEAILVGVESLDLSSGIMLDILAWSIISVYSTYHNE